METKAIIIDDEKRGIVALEQLILRYCKDVRIIAKATNIREGAACIQALSPDVVFLDVEMPEGNGFELFELLDEINFSVIFVTAFEEYAIKAIRNAALDYLLKPVKVAELQDAVNRVKEKKKEKHRHDLIKEHISGGIASHKIILSDIDGYYPIKIEDIVYCKSNSSYTHFFLKNDKQHVISRQLKEYEDMLQPFSFCRIHKSYLINMGHIDQVKRQEGTMFVTMSNGVQLPVSFRKRDEFVERFKQIS